MNLCVALKKVGINDMKVKKEIYKKQMKLEKLKIQVGQLEQVINDLKIVSRQRCPVNMVCQCGADKNWDGVCKMAD